MVAFFGNQQRNWRKVHQFGAMTFFRALAAKDEQFVFCKSAQARGPPAKNFDPSWITLSCVTAPPVRNFAPALEQRSNCSSDQVNETS